MEAASQEQPVLPVDHGRSNLANAIFLREHPSNSSGHLLQFHQDLLQRFWRKVPTATHPRRDQRQNRDLSQEGFGGGHADLWADPQVHPGIGFAGNGGTHHIHHSERKCPTFACFPQSSQGVGGFSGLTDRNHHGAFFHHRVAVPELAGVGGFCGNTTPMFNQLSANHGRMQRCPLPQQHHPAGLHKLSGVIGQTAQHHFAAPQINASSQRTLEGLGLFVDLFVHEVRMPAQLNLLEVVFEFTKLRGHFVVVEGTGSEFSAFTTNQLIVFEGKRSTGVRHNRRSIRSHHKLFVTNAHQQRRTPPGRNQHAGLTNTDHGNGERPLHFVQSGTHGGFQIIFVQLAHQMGQHFGVRLPLEDMPTLR